MENKEFNNLSGIDWIIVLMYGVIFVETLFISANNDFYHYFLMYDIAYTAIAIIAFIARLIQKQKKVCYVYMALIAFTIIHIYILYQYNAVNT